MNKIIRPNYKHYSFGVQESLPLDVVITIADDDPVQAFLEAIEGIDLTKYFPPIRSNNTHSKDRTILLRTVLFAYSQGVRSTRDIADLCQHDVRFIYLSDMEQPSFMTFERMFQLLETSIDDVFFDVTQKLVEKMNIDPNIQYVDGTKIEANANKNTFVYKKRIINARDRKFCEIRQKISDLNSSYGYSYPIKDSYTSYDLFYICQYLIEVMAQKGITVQYGKGQRKTEIQRIYDDFLKIALKLQEYEDWLEIIGDRGSCSKIDHDATMMATKWDYYNQTGVTRPCYNGQIAVADGIIVNSNIYQNPTDQLTWIPFMIRYHKHYGYYPKWPVADAGYGSYDNYLFNIQKGIGLVQKYNYYGKTKDPKFRKRIYNQVNWPVNEDGFKICPNGRVFDTYRQDKWTWTTRGNLSIKQIYCEKDNCKGCPLIKDCTKSAYGRSVSRDVILEELQAKVNKNLSGETGEEWKKQRSIQVEGAFGVIKQDFKFTRFSRKGLKGVRMEFLLVCLGYNLKKYYLFWSRQQAAGVTKALN